MNILKYAKNVYYSIGVGSPLKTGDSTTRENVFLIIISQRDTEKSQRYTEDIFIFNCVGISLKTGDPTTLGNY